MGYAKSIPGLCGAVIVLCLGLGMPTAGAADERIGKAIRMFERTCVSNAGKASAFPTRKVESGFKASEKDVPRGAVARLWLMPGKSCRIDFGGAPMTRSEAFSDALLRSAVTFAARVGGSVEHRRRGKNNEKVVVETALAEYVLELASERRSGVIEELSMSYKPN